jgi:polyisoprenoid-binding protein YceI
MIISRSIPVLVVIAATHTIRANDTYMIDPARSNIGFLVHQFFGLTKGKFTRFAGTIAIDREHPERSSVEAKIHVKSIDTGIKKRDEHLVSPELFDAQKYPLITFKSRSVKQSSTQAGDIVGDLTMHGVTKPVTLHVKLITPLRAIVPGYFGEKNVKWITRIEVADANAKGFYETQGWGPDFIVPTRSRIDVPNNWTFFSLGKLSAPIEVKGIAFGGDRGVSRVEFSVDSGKTWSDAEIYYSGGNLAWSLWKTHWGPPRRVITLSSSARPMARATSRNGMKVAVRSPVPPGFTRSVRA